jgi:hypothetical protein
VIIGNAQEAPGSAKFIASSKLSIGALRNATNLSLGNTSMTVMLLYTVLGVIASSERKKNLWSTEEVPSPVM